MLKKPLLPEWRYWPALALAGLILVGMFGFASSPPPQKIGGDTPKTEKSQDDPNQRLANYTFWLTILTGGIVLTGFLQILVLLKADNTARMGIKIAARQGVISRRQMEISGQQTDILAAQKDMQRQEFLITHRPKMRLRGLDFLPSDKESEFIARLSNVGATEANILAFKLVVSLIGESGQITHLLPDEFSTEKSTVGSGNTFWIRRTVIEGGTPFEKASRRLMASGAVLYRDGMDRVRTTSFGRQNIPGSIRMNSVDGIEDMNWED
jgi:hypothetical protein